MEWVNADEHHEQVEALRRSREGSTVLKRAMDEADGDEMESRHDAAREGTVTERLNNGS
ncbi:hypothetical protein W02_35750 [Nitrospira sp. KM1]|nr:hypothetical protein W02_35750 [Nitrospira sp. KM1]